VEDPGGGVVSPAWRGGKKAAIYLARKLTRLTGQEIGKAFGVKPARMSNFVTEIESGRDPPLACRRRTCAGVSAQNV
jgi:transcriptional regulator with XRE-family HTH domain